MTTTNEIVFLEHFQVKLLFGHEPMNEWVINNYVSFEFELFVVVISLLGIVSAIQYTFNNLEQLAV